MRPVILVAVALIGLALPAADNAAWAQRPSLTVTAHKPVGNLPPKPPAGDPGSVAVVGDRAGSTAFLITDEMAKAVASAQEAGPNGEMALRVMAVPGNGGLQNIRDVLTRPGVDFGIVPVPVLQAAAETNGMANLRQRLAYVAPLYVEEVHLLAGPGITRPDDLAGRAVAIGPEGSSTEYLANEVLDRLGIKVLAHNLDTRGALAALRDGKVAAAFVISGKPVGELANLAGADLRILPLPLDAVPEGFNPTSLSHADYPGLIGADSTVATYGVPTVLFGYSWPPNSARGRVGQSFIAMLMYRLPDLQVGLNHPKWREINVAATLPGWTRLGAMQAWLAKPRPRQDEPVSQAEFNEFLARTGTRDASIDRDALFQDFQRWRAVRSGR